MYCTICEVEIDDFSHYKSEIHGINARRKLLKYPPLISEELDQHSVEDDLSLDLNYSTVMPEKVYFLDFSIEKNNKCLFCDEKESARHYHDHGFNREQCYYLSVMRCYVCFEKFVDREMLLKHLNQEAHRTAFTNGFSLFLKNGKILNPNKIHMPVKNNGFWIENNNLYKEIVKRPFFNRSEEEKTDSSE